MSLMLFTTLGNPRASMVLEKVAELVARGAAPGFEVECCSVLAHGVDGVGLFDRSLRHSVAHSNGGGHLAFYAPKLLREQLGQQEEELASSQGWPTWVCSLDYAVAIGEAAVSDEALLNRASFVLNVFTKGAKVNARKPDCLPWRQSKHALQDPRRRFDWKLRRVTTISRMGSC